MVESVEEKAPARRVVIVVPCYDEAARLPTQRFLDCAKTHPEIDFTFVDDGSSDDTRAVLDELAAAQPERISIIGHDTNQGKAVAVRTGVLAAFSSGATYIGYWDADLATPLEEIPRFCRTLEEKPAVDLVMGARVHLLGRAIHRRALRHYLGRVVATAISRTLKISVYDTQCGAKLFRATARAQTAFEEPFVTGWLFDVEIVARLLGSHTQEDRGAGRVGIVELPLERWNDVPGSKVQARDFFRAFLDLRRIRKHYRL